MRCLVLPPVILPLLALLLHPSPCPSAARRRTLCPPSSPSGGRRILGAEIPAVVADGGAGAGQGAAQRVAERLVPGTGVAAFLAAAGIVELSDLAKRLYAPDEKPDAPDNAPARRW